MVTCLNCNEALAEAGPVCSACGRALPERAPGDIVGNYKIIRVLGQGGMGCVYEAEHLKLGRRDAIKTLQRNYAGNADIVQRFFAEARAVNRLQHDNVVQIFDFVEAADSNYYVMELLAGEDLRTVLRREGRIELKRAVRLASQIAAALTAVHEVGLIHGDLKPENLVIVNARGVERVKLFDFGLVAVQGEGAGAIHGTPQYMAPEAFRGLRGTKGIDVYAFGVLLFELLVGQMPFDADDLFGWKAVHETSLPPNPGTLAEIPEHLSNLTLACLEKSPRTRLQDLGEAESLLEQTLASFDIGAVMPVVALPAKKNRLPLFAGAAGATLALAALGAWFGLSRPSAPIPPGPPLPVAEATVEPAPVALVVEAPPLPPVEKKRAGKVKKKKKGLKDPGVIDAFGN